MESRRDSLSHLLNSVVSNAGSETAKAHILLNSLRISRKSVVFSKYAGAILFGLFVCDGKHDADSSGAELGAGII